MKESFIWTWYGSLIGAEWRIYASVKVWIAHWGRVTHICVSKLTIIDSDNGLSPCRRQAIVWINAGILLIRPLATNFSEISIEIRVFSFKKIYLKISSGKYRPFCLGLNVLSGRTIRLYIHHRIFWAIRTNPFGLIQAFFLWFHIIGFHISSWCLFRFMSQNTYIILYRHCICIYIYICVCVCILSLLLSLSWLYFACYLLSGNGSRSWCYLLIVTDVNSLAPGGFENIFKNVFFKLISWIDTLSNSCETALRSMPQNPSDDKSTLVQVMAWCRQAASHYLSQCCPRSLSPYGVTRPQWVK